MVLVLRQVIIQMREKKLCSSYIWRCPCLNVLSLYFWPAETVAVISCLFVPIRFPYFCKAEKKLISHNVFGDWPIPTFRKCWKNK